MGDFWKEGGLLGGGGQRRKKWENCSSIINKIYLKKEKVYLIKERSECKKSENHPTVNTVLGMEHGLLFLSLLFTVKDLLVNPC